MAGQVPGEAAAPKLSNFRDRPRAGPGRGKKKQPPPEPAEPAEWAAHPAYLRDMLWVYNFEPHWDKTPGRKACRQMLKEQPRVFFEQMRLSSAGGGKDETKAAVVDEGSQKCLALARELLRKWHDERQEG